MRVETTNGARLNYFRHVCTIPLSIALIFSACLALGIAPAANAHANEKTSSQSIDTANTTGETAPAWSLDSNCIDCHASQARYLGEASSITSDNQAIPEKGGTVKDESNTETKESAETVGQPHADSLAETAPIASSHASSTCTDCHNDEDGLAKVHKNVKAIEEADISRLKKTAIDENYCFSCHESWEGLAELTSDSEVLVDNNGTTVNPHDFPDIAEHADITCDSCHYMHKEKTAEETSRALCGSCHHAGVYECYTCH